MLPLMFRIATEPEEFEQIFQLNYRTFVEEIPQHQPNTDLRLVDKFHDQNTYIVCLREQRVVGMIAVRSERPFSLDAKLENLDAYLPKGRSVCEVRLLSVDPNYRKGPIFRGLLKELVEYCLAKGYDSAIISGTVRQQRLYRHMGFVPFGPLVGTADALYQPMYLSVEAFSKEIPWIQTSIQASIQASPQVSPQTSPQLSPQTSPQSSPQLSTQPSFPLNRASQDNASCTQASHSSCTKASHVPINLLPGPVHIHPDVRQAFCDIPISHRSHQFVENVQEIKARLCELVGAARVELFLGSGTLANDVICAQLSRHRQPSWPGIILSNGEFGERLVDHAKRFDLRLKVLAADWGSPFNYPLIDEFLRQHTEIRWVWCVHCETSTGVLNDLQRVAAICKERKVLVCLDCISSIGTAPVDLKDIYLASGVSGKGLAAFPGLSFVFSNCQTPPAPDKLPRYLDLGYYAQKNGLPFTTSSNLLYALLAALKRIQPDERFCRIKRLSGWLRNELRNRGFSIVAPDECASAAVITIALPAHLSSRWVGLRLEEQGYLLSHQSEYLLERNWIQICLMGEYSENTLAPVLGLLSELVKKPKGNPCDADRAIQGETSSQVFYPSNNC